MKKLIYLLSITVALTIFSSSNASAKTLSSGATVSSAVPGVMCDLLGDILGSIFGNNNNHSGSGGSGSGGSGGNSGSTQLPINGGVEFLMIAGAIIGIATVQRHKIVKTAAQK